MAERKPVISELQKRSKISGSVISKIVDSLKEKGLIEDKYEMEDRTRKRLIYLTEKGKKVAELLNQIENILSRQKGHKAKKKL